jgi:hypothetical protein
MTEQDWAEYIKATPTFKACLDAHCAGMGDYGYALSWIYTTLSGRIHAELELSRDYIVVCQDWLSREQVLCVACLLTQERYYFKLDPPIPGFGIQDEEE